MALSLGIRPTNRTFEAPQLKNLSRTSKKKLANTNNFHRQCKLNQIKMPKPKPRIRKRRVLDRLRAQQSKAPTSSAALLAADDAQANSTALELIPTSKVEQEARRTALREELLANTPQTKVSRKKAARLEKYIELKLKKEDNAEIVKKLASVRVDLDGMKSSGELGKGAKIFANDYSRHDRMDTGQESAESEDGSEAEEASAEATKKQISASSNSFGSGLKRPLPLDDAGRPILTKRVKTKGQSFPKFFPTTLPVPENEEFNASEDESEWGGLSSDASQVSNGDPESEDNSSSEDSVATESSDDVSEESESILDEDEELEAVAAKSKLRARSSAFKAWAEKQRNESLGFTPSNQLDAKIVQPKVQIVPRPLEEDPLPAELIPGSNTTRTAHAVQVIRSEEVQDARLKLPVVEKEQQIMEAIFNHDVVIVSGATGSGKTTQIPQFLLENGFGDSSGPTPGMIGITQPRRVAAVSMAKRVGQELGNMGDAVAHQIRFDTTVGDKTLIKFMTDGVLLRELSEDFSLKKYSAIVIDEAHERTVNTDILISLMSRCVKARTQLARERPAQYTRLKLIIMSATLRVSDFRENSRLFTVPPPLVEAEGRQYEVTVHWSRKTTHSFLDEIVRKVSRGHRQLPPGGFLVFLPGQSDIRQMARLLKETFAATEAAVDHPKVRVSADQMPVEDEDWNFDRDDQEPALNEDSDSDLEIEGLDEDNQEFNIGEEKPTDLLKVHVLPLYSQLPSKEQLKVFKEPPEGSRMIVLATNVAETSLTIPGVRYVFDSGRVKEREWDHAGVQTFHTTWVSKASADQRMGRAGRTGPGHCYRLYSSALYETFTDFAEPEIYRSPLEGVVLQLKALNIGRLDVFPFPTPPDRTNLIKSELLLKHLGALDPSGRITPLGRELHNYPLNPRFAQLLRLGRLYNCTDLVIATAAALDVPELFVSESSLQYQDENDLDNRHEGQLSFVNEARQKAFNSAQGRLARLCPFSDAIKLLAAVIEYSGTDDSEEWCNQNFARQKAFKEVSQLRDQLTSITRNLHPGSTTKFGHIASPSEKQIAILRQIVAAGFIDQVAIRADLLPTPPAVDRKPKRAIDVRYQTLFPSFDSSQISSEDEKFVYIHPSSVLAHKSPSKLPPFVVYHRLQRSQHGRSDKTPRTRMHPLTSVSGHQLAVLAKGTTLLQISKPRTRVTTLPSVDGKERRQCRVDLSLAGRDIDIGWFLTQKDVIQSRTRDGWVIDEYC
jgi:ATP-dependent RNA helicase DHX37/DHR1